MLTKEAGKTSQQAPKLTNQWKDTQDERDVMQTPDAPWSNGNGVTHESMARFSQGPGRGALQQVAKHWGWGAECPPKSIF